MLTAAFTILGGVIIYTLGQIIAKFFIEPIHKQLMCIGKISDSLIFYANQYSNPGSGMPDEMDKVQRILRQQASLLVSKTHVIKWYGFFEIFKFVPKRIAISEASRELIGLSNSIHEGRSDFNTARVKNIKKALNIKF